MIHAISRSFSRGRSLPPNSRHKEAPKPIREDFGSEGAKRKRRCRKSSYLVLLVFVDLNVKISISKNLGDKNSDTNFITLTFTFSISGTEIECIILESPAQVLSFLLTDPSLLQQDDNFHENQ